MFNKEFLKKLTILYVEDDDLARTQLSKILNRLFKNVIQAKNGLEGFETYQEHKLTDSKIDLILSDINMPKLSGIEMLEKIREHDKEIPVIFTTARSETEYLLKAISLNANHYALKPIDKEDVILRIQKVCEKKYFEEIIQRKTLELKEYLSVINSVATIVKIDENKNISFVNNLFLEASSFVKDDLIGKEFNSIISSEVDKNSIEKMWEKVNLGKTWKDDLKFINKNNNIFYIKSTFFKIENENKSEYINIGFISTDEVNEKRAFHKKMLNNIKEKNIQASQSQSQVSSLQELNKAYEEKINSLMLELKKEKQKQADVTSQVKYYESEILDSDRVTNSLKAKNKEIEELQELVKAFKKDKNQNTETINELNKELRDSKIELEKLFEKIRIKEKRIDDLNEIIQLRENQLRKLDSSLVD